MRKYIYALIVFIITVSCNNMEVGFLETTTAAYHPARMVIRKELNLNDWLDERRYDDKANWVSPPIQGVLGTAPIFITIDKVRAEDGGNVETFMKYTVLRGNGQFDVDFENKIPIGKYIISLKVTNEGRSSILEDIFIIDVREK